MEKKKLSLTSKIFIGLVSGLVLGVCLYYFIPDSSFKQDIIIDGFLYVIGQGFVRLLQMLVVPLVFFSLSTGALSMGDTASLGKIGIKTLALYLLTTAAAIGLALGLANFTRPGLGMALESLAKSDFSIAEAPSIADTFLNLIPTNPIRALAEGEMLQVILFALLVGYICAKLPENLSIVSRILNEGNDLMMEMTQLVMKVAPVGVFALIARTFSGLGFETLLPMATYMLTVLGGLVLQVVLVYLPMLVLMARLHPGRFIKKVLPVTTFAFSSASSGATIPITLQATDNMGIPRSISSFTIPLGATINMDGTAIMQGVAVIFISNAYGIPLSLGDFMMVILTATLASVGTAAVPGVGLITLSMVLQSVGLPVEGIAMIMGIDRILDMARTAINATGDCVVTLICTKQAGVLDINQYNDSIPLVESDEF